MTIRCKMVCTKLEGGKVAFECRYDAELCKEDRSFQTATPWGTVEFQIDNPKAIEQLEVGKAYYFDVSPATES